MSAFNLILDQIAALRARMDRERTTLRLGTVQSSGTVLLTDGAEVTPAARLTDTATGDIVLVGQHNRRTYVLGKPPQATTSAAATIASGWAVAGGETPTVTKSGDVVTFTGRVVRSSGTSKDAMTIPAGYRPAARQRIANIAVNSGNVTGPIFSVAYVEPDGTVTLDVVADASPAWDTSTWIAVSGAWVAA